MKSLEYALEEINEEHFIFKSRTDVYIQPKALKKY